LNLGSLPLVLLAGASLLWLGWRQRVTRGG